MKTIKSMLGISLVLFTTHALAHEALWQLDFDKEVEWSKITDAGILLVGESDMMLMGID